MSTESNPRQDVPPAPAARRAGWGVSSATLGYVAPFAVFIFCLMLQRVFPARQELIQVFRFVLALAAICVFSRRYFSLRPSVPLASLALGVAVFVVWIGPDLLWPGYRAHWLFQNGLMGDAASTIPRHLRRGIWFLAIRTASTCVIVPILEELFWRGWLMRWLIRSDFTAVPLGTYKAQAFWLSAVLFASEHGPYWEVGLLAGVAYNWWLVRTRSLADCILAHAVTNGCLAAYVILRGEWQYWL